MINSFSQLRKSHQTAFGIEKVQVFHKVRVSRLIRIKPNRHSIGRIEFAYTGRFNAGWNSKVFIVGLFFEFLAAISVVD
jgi:hypothetical protein